MAISKKNSRRIQDYLDGSMITDERQSFERDCASDEYLAAELAAMATIQRELQNHEVNAFRNLVTQAIAQQAPPVPQVTPTGQGKNRFALLLVLAIGFITTGACFLVLRRPINPPPEKEQNTPADTLILNAAPIAKQQEEPITPEKPRVSQQPIRTKPTAAAGEKETAYQQLAMAEFTASTFILRGTFANSQPKEATASVFNYYAKANKESDSLLKQQLLKTTLALLDSMSVDTDERLLLTRAQTYFESGQYGLAALDFEALRSSFAYDQNADLGAMLCYLAQMPDQQEAFQQAVDMIIKNKDHDFRLKVLAIQKKVASIE